VRPRAADPGPSRVSLFAGADTVRGFPADCVPKRSTRRAAAAVRVVCRTATPPDVFRAAPREQTAVGDAGADDHA
jgi:hypothetical protein